MRVIAVDSFTDDSGTFHPYGHEFTMADSAERARLLQAGIIRTDDREMTCRRSESPPNSA